MYKRQPFWWKCIRKNRNIKGELSVDKKELISSMLSLKDNIGMWKIVLNQITDADFVIGYGFDNNDRPGYVSFGIFQAPLHRHLSPPLS